MPRGRPIRLRLFDILDAVHGIELIVGGKAYQDYAESFADQRAVERLLEILSEAVRYVPDDMRARFPQIPWVIVEAFGNKTRHEYQTISPKRIWRVAAEDIPPLKAVIKELYAEVKRPADPRPDAE